MKDKQGSEARPENICDHSDDGIENGEQDTRHIPEFNRKERETSADSKGIKAEVIKGADEETSKMIYEIFNLIIK